MKEFLQIYRNGAIVYLIIWAFLLFIPGVSYLLARGILFEAGALLVLGILFSLLLLGPGCIALVQSMILWIMCKLDRRVSDYLGLQYSLILSVLYLILCLIMFAVTSNVIVSFIVPFFIQFSLFYVYIRIRSWRLKPEVE